MARRIEPSEAFAALAQLRLRETDVQGASSRVAELAKVTMPSAAEVSVTLIEGNRTHTAAFTGQVAMDLDETQYECGDGPCLHAAAQVSTIRVRDLHAETRWPEFAAAATERGVTGSLSVGLPVTEVVLGALNIYATRPRPFDEQELDLARRFADYAAAVLGNAYLHDASTTLVGQLRTAMAGRAVIEQAKGVVMKERRCDAAEAFRFISQQSQNTNRKLRDVAADIVSQATAGTTGVVAPGTSAVSGEGARTSSGRGG